MTPEDVFPLPLAPIEEYMLHDDRPEQPMTMFCRFRLKGKLDRALIEAQAVPMLTRHPLLQAVVDQTGRTRPTRLAGETSRTAHRRGGRLTWRLAGPDAVPRRYLSDAPWTDLAAIPGIDPFAEPGLRVWFDDRGEDMEILFQVHHAAADGLGALQTAIEFLAGCHSTYHGGPDGGKLRTTDVTRLRERHKFGLTPLKLLAIAPQQAIGLAGAAQFLSRKPVPLVGAGATATQADEAASHAADGSAGPPTVPAGYPHFETLLLTLEETAGYVAAANRLGRTTNDLTARDVFVAVDQWRRSLSRGADGDWLRMMVPVNLRQYADRRLPAANCVSMVFLDRTPAQIADPDRLLDSINEEVQLILKNRLGLTFVLSLGVAKFVPGGIAEQCKATDCRSSLILTNLGEPLARLKLPRKDGHITVANTQIVGMDLISPLRPHTNIGLSVFKFEGRFGVTNHWNPRVMTGEEGRDLLRRIGDQMRRTAAGNC